MTIREALRTHLMAQASVAALVAARIYPLRLPQTPVLPALTIQYISGRTLITHGGMSPTRPSQRVQVDCWDKTPDGAEALAEAVRDAAGAYRGTWGDVPVSASLLDDDRETFEVPTGLYRRILDFLITARPA